MNPQEPVDQPDPHNHVANDLKVTQAGERTLCEIKRHPIGIVGVYTMSGLLLVLVALAIFGLLPHITSNSAISALGIIILFFLVIICSAYSLIFTKVYWGNTWTLTTDSITQITQTSLMNRRSSQLSLDVIEDVSAEQDGLLAHIFNYGLIRVETAGEHEKYTFTFCPNPNYYAREILAAHEALQKGTPSAPGQAYYAQPVPPPVEPPIEPPEEQLPDPGRSYPPPTHEQ